MLGVKPSYATGFAQWSGMSEYPGLWTGLVGAWAPFLGATGSKVFDLSGNGNTGTNYGIAWQAGGIKYDGVNDYTEIAHSSSMALGTNDFTIVVKFKEIDSTDAAPALIGKGDSGPTEWMLRLTDVVGGEWNLAFFGDGGGISPASPTKVVKRGQKHIAVVVRRGTVVTLYLDNVLLAIDSSSGDDLSTTKTLRLANADASPSRFFGGIIYWAYIYNKRALTASEIALLTQLRKRLA